MKNIKIYLEIGKGYVIDEDYIKKTLIRKYLNQNKGTKSDSELAQEYERLSDSDDKKKNIKRALDVYKTLKEKVVAKPKESALEGQWKKSKEKKDNERAERFENQKKNRITWFADAWKDNMFGVFKYYGASDQNVVARAAGGVARTSEEIKFRRSDTKDKERSGLILVKNGVRKGEDTWGVFKSYLSGLKSGIKDDLHPDRVNEIGMQEMRRFALMLTRDEDAKTVLGELDYWLNKRNKRSLAAASYTNWVGKDLGPSEMKAFLQVFVNEGALSPEEAGKISADFDSTWFDVAKYIAPRVGILLLMMATTTFIKKSYEEAEGGKGK
jgi:hypothetical protein